MVDASALVSILKQESTATKMEAALKAAFGLAMTSVTLTEVALLGLKIGETAEDTAAWVAGMGIEIVPVDESLGIASAEARHRYPIRFGDGFVYALAKARGLPVLTLDEEFAKTDAMLVPMA